MTTYYSTINSSYELYNTHNETHIHKYNYLRIYKKLLEINNIFPNKPINKSHTLLSNINTINKNDENENNLFKLERKVYSLIRSNKRLHNYTKITSSL